MMVATLGIALPEVRQSLSLSEIAAGSLFSTIFIVAAVSSTIAGRLADRIGRKFVLITGLGALALGFAVAGISSSLLVVRVFLGLTGLGYGFITPSLYAIMSDLLPQRRGLGASLVSVSYGIGGAIGAVLASRIRLAAGICHRGRNRHGDYVAGVLLDSQLESDTFNNAIRLVHTHTVPSPSSPLPR